jgi:arabinofuranosyltransferase
MKLAMSAKRSRNSGRPTWDVWAVALAVFGVRLAYIAYARLTFEDAFISLRYAVNWAGGRGLVYNPGEHVFGATTPLYVLLLGLFALLKAGSPLLCGKLLCAAADAATAGLWYTALVQRTGRRVAGLTFAVMFGLSPYIVEVSASGMETSLVLLGVTVAFLAEQANRPVLFGVAVGLTGLVRLDSLLFGGILLVDAGLRRRRLPWREAAVAVACMAPWLLFSWDYYGSMIPNSIPAKLAAYQAHRPSFIPNLKNSLSYFVPYRHGARAGWFNAAVAPLFLLGCVRLARRERDWWPLAAFFFAHWSFLVLSRSLLFRWYLPPALLPYYLVAGLGAATVAARLQAAGVLRASSEQQGARRPRPAFVTHALRVTPYACLFALTLHAGLWLSASTERARRLQKVEDRTRREIGLWLARNTPPWATVCTEPIGYIGYYSGRRILDEVGLVSPQLIPFVRAGNGWFARILQVYRPDYVVERDYFLRRNATINVFHIRMFATAEDRRWFEQSYVPLRWYGRDVAPFSRAGYGLVIFARRDHAVAFHQRAELVARSRRRRTAVVESGRPAERILPIYG